MDSMQSSSRLKENNEVVVKRLKNRGNMEKLCTIQAQVVLRDLNCDNNEESKENVTSVVTSTKPPNTNRRSRLTPDHSGSNKVNGELKSASRTRKQRTSVCKENCFSSDEDDGRRSTRKKNDCVAGTGRFARKAASAVVDYKDWSSAEDSMLEDEGPKTSSASKHQVEDSNTISNNKSPPEWTKRKKEESDSDAVRRATRKSLRLHSPPKDKTRNTDDAGPSQINATSQLTGMPKSLKRKVALPAEDGEVPRSARATRSHSISELTVTCDDDEGTPLLAARRRTPRAARTPKSANRSALSLRPRRSVMTSLESPSAKTPSGDEESDMSERTNRARTARPTRPTRRSMRVLSNEESTDGGDEDFVPRGRKERLPRSVATPKSSKRAKTPVNVDAVGTEDVSVTDDGESMTVKTKTPKKNGKTPKKKSPAKTPRNLRPAMPERSSSIPDAGSSLDVIRANLHVSAVPKSLPCREKEFNDIYRFVAGKISDSAGGCMYISGMPGTGKTATVHAVVRRLEQEVEEGILSPFQYIEVNGLRLTEPRQVFVRILQQMTGEKCTPQQAQEILAKKFTSGKGFSKAVLLLVDEVDMLRNRRQDVVYNLFDWPSKARSKLVVLTIANTMDLPERLLMGRVTSRLGLTRLTFQPYNYKQLQEIVTARLQGSDYFNSDAVQIVARKVAAVSGDARRALDICRRATELLNGENECVTMTVVDNALKQMMNSASIKTIKACSRMEQIFLQAVMAEMKRTGVEETDFNAVYRQLKSMCDLTGITVPSVSQSLTIANRLGSSRILLTEHGRSDILQTIFLNVNSDDIHYAITKPTAA